MSGTGAGPRTQQYGTTNDVFTKSDATNRGALVLLASNMDKDEVTSGRVRLTQVSTEPPQSVNYLVDSQDKVSGTAFNFVVNMQSNLFRCRLIQVSKVLLPVINNITINNNLVAMRFFFSTTNQWRYIFITLDVGFYDPTSFCNEISSKVQDYVLANYAGDMNFANTLLIGAYSPASNHISFQFLLNAQVPAVANVAAPFYFISSSSFIVRGRAFAHFQAFPDTGTLIAPVGVSNYYESGSAGMLYTRYVTLHSDALNQFSYADSRTSDNNQGGKIVAIIGVAGSIINAAQFTGAFVGGEIVQAPVISVLNPQKMLQKFLDFYVRDEYGTDLGEAFPPGHQLGIVLWLHSSF